VYAASNGLPDSRVDEVIGLVGLADVATRRAGGFSLGMAQRLGLAQALLGDPPVVILDEPANGLDPDGIIWIRTFMRYLADQGHSVFVSSHMLSELGQVVDDLVVIGKGRLLALGSLHDVLGTGGRDAVTVVSPDATRLAELIRDRGATVSGDDSSRLEVAGLDAVAVGELAAAQGIVLHELTPREPSLEDAYLRLTSESREFLAGGSE
jgi:ABC-2 type transport system ATP-binding protein